MLSLTSGRIQAELELATETQAQSKILFETTFTSD